MIGKKLSDPLRVISVHCETAVDWSQSEGGKLAYLESRNFSLLKFREGQQPTIFTIAPLSPGVLARVRSQANQVDLLTAFQFGVVDCSDDSVGLRWDKSGDTHYIELNSMGNLPAIVWREIGSLVLQREDLSLGELPRYVLSR